MKKQHCAWFDDVKEASVTLSALTNQLYVLTSFTAQAMDKHTKRSASCLFG